MHSRFKCTNNLEELRKEWSVYGLAIDEWKSLTKKSRRRDEKSIKSYKIMWFFFLFETFVTNSFFFFFFIFFLLSQMHVQNTWYMARWKMPTLDLYEGVKFFRSEINRCMWDKYISYLSFPQALLLNRLWMKVSVLCIDDSDSECNHFCIIVNHVFR